MRRRRVCVWVMAGAPGYLRLDEGGAPGVGLEAGRGASPSSPSKARRRCSARWTSARDSACGGADARDLARRSRAVAGGRRVATSNSSPCPAASRSACCASSGRWRASCRRPRGRRTRRRGCPSASSAGVVPSRALPTLMWASRKDSGRPGCEGLQPEGDLGQFGGHRVEVDAVDAAGDDVVHRGLRGRRGSGRSSPVRAVARRSAMRRAAATRKCPEPQAGSQTVMAEERRLGVGGLLGARRGAGRGPSSRTRSMSAVGV